MNNGIQGNQSAQASAETNNAYQTPEHRPAHLPGNSAAASPLAQNAAGLAMAMPQPAYTALQQARFANRQARFEVNMALAAAGVPLPGVNGLLNAFAQAPANVVALHNELPAPINPPGLQRNDALPMVDLERILQDLLGADQEASSPPQAPRTPSPTLPGPETQRRRLN